IDAVRPASPKVRKEPRPRILSRPEKDGVRMRCGLLGQRRYMQTAHYDVRSAPAIVIRDVVRAICRRDVDLNDDEIRRILEVQSLDMFILYFCFVFLVQVGGECAKAEW